MKPFDHSTITEGAALTADAAQFARAEERFSLVARLATAKRSLEVAAGTGYGLPISSSRAAFTVAGDLNRTNLAAARGLAPQAPLVQFDACHAPFRSGSFELVACLEALYYFTDLRTFLVEAARLLAVGGEVVLSWPNPARPSFSPSPGSTWYPRPHELRSILAETGFTEIHLLGSSVAGPDGGSAHLVHRLLARSGLMPDTLRGRARLKRLMLRRVRPLGMVQLTDVEPRELDPEDPGLDHAVLYATARARS